MLAVWIVALGGGFPLNNVEFWRVTRLIPQELTTDGMTARSDSHAERIWDGSVNALTAGSLNCVGREGVRGMNVVFRSCDNP